MSRIDKDDAPSLILIRFSNLVGALVVVTATELGRRTLYAWQCTGCFDQIEGGTLGLHRRQANEHAAICRALPQPEPHAA